MRRQARFKKIKLSSFFGDVRDLLFKKMLNVVVAAIFIAMAFLLIKAFLYKSDYFRLKDVEMKDVLTEARTASFVTNQLMNVYGGKNIFKINLKTIAASLRDAYPDAKEVSVRISPPDKLVVDIKLRRPVALVMDSRLYPIDGEGVVLPGMDPFLLKDLPVIEGIDIKYRERRGGRCSSENLAGALKLLREIKNSRFISAYGVARIYAGNTENMSFYLKNGVEIKIGAEDTANRLRILEKTLKDPRLLIDRIKYIDVRYRDVIIGPND